MRADQEAWFGRIEAELPNVRAALDWCLAHPDEGAAIGLRMVGALVPFWQLGLHLREGSDWANSLMASAPAGLPERVLGFWAVGFLAWHLGDRVAAQSAWEDGLEQAQLEGHPQHLANLLNGVGFARLNLGQWEEADRLLTDAVALSGISGDIWMAGLGTFAMAQAQQARGNFERARTLMEESIEPLEQLGDRRNRSYFLLGIGHLSLDTGELERADEAYRAALVFTSQLGDNTGMVWALEGLTFVASARRQVGQVARLLGVVEAVRARLGVTPHPVPGWGAHRERAVAVAVQALGENGLRAAVAAGRLEESADVIAELLSLSPPGRRTRNSSATLSPRETEVAVLLGQGLTNRQIAQRLVIASGTAQRHVANILAKLGFVSRAQVAVWVVSSELGVG